MRFDGKAVVTATAYELALDDGSTVRGYNPDLIELDAGETHPVEQASNESTIRQQATTALQGNRDFLALASPTNAQTLAQVKALTRQNNGLIRLLLRQFDGTD